MLFAGRIDQPTGRFVRRVGCGRELFGRSWTGEMVSLQVIAAQGRQPLSLARGLPHGRVECSNELRS